MKMRWIVGVLATSLISAAAAADREGIMLLYQVQEPDLDPYTSRILVTPEFMRMDDGDVAGDFVLFDRRTGHIYSVTHGEHTILDIPKRAVTVESPIKLQTKTESVALDKGTPHIAGGEPEHRVLTVNGQKCLDIITVAGILQDAVAAQKEYRTALAGEQARILPSIPADTQEPCDLALNVFSPRWQLDFGVSIRQWDGEGHVQALVDFAEHYRMEDALFQLPEGYRQYGTEDVR